MGANEMKKSGLKELAKFYNNYNFIDYRNPKSTDEYLDKFNENINMLIELAIPSIFNIRKKYENEIDIVGSIFEDLTKKLVKKDRLYKVQENLRPLYGSKILEQVIAKDSERGPIINQFLKALVGSPVIGQKF